MMTAYKHSMGYSALAHCRPLRPRSFWSALKSDWLRIQNKYSEHAQQMGTGQRSRFLVLTKRIVASGDENGVRSPKKMQNTPALQATSVKIIFHSRRASPTFYCCSPLGPSPSLVLFMFWHISLTIPITNLEQIKSAISWAIKITAYRPNEWNLYPKRYNPFMAFAFTS